MTHHVRAVFIGVDRMAYVGTLVDVATARALAVVPPHTQSSTSAAHASDDDAFNAF